MDVVMQHQENTAGDEPQQEDTEEALPQTNGHPGGEAREKMTRSFIADDDRMEKSTHCCTEGQDRPPPQTTFLELVMTTGRRTPLLLPMRLFNCSKEQQQG